MNDRDQKLELKLNLAYLKDDPKYRKENQITVNNLDVEFHLLAMYRAGIKDLETSLVYWGKNPADTPPLTKIKFKATDAQFETYVASLRN